MQEYVGLASGHMEFLIRALDGEPGEVSPPDIPPLPTTVSPELVHEAIAYLRRTSLVIEPRRKWPVGGLPVYGVSGRIDPDRRAEPGKALSIYRDAGWGSVVHAGKYQDGRFADELVSASRALIEEWGPEPAPTWVTCIPSRRHPELVPDFARRLAAALDLPFEPILVKTEDREEQKDMANSSKQARNVDGSLAVDGEPPAGPVLLVDDMVDSRWTFTVAAWLLRAHGSGEVWPFALADSGGSG
jgi:ATP-dependent DNA helicase RecQ